MGARKPPSGPPPSAGVLARYAQAYARELGVAEGRVRAWVAYTIMAGVLERHESAGAPRFIVKGGVALELRLRDRARATKDIDIVLAAVGVPAMDIAEERSRMSEMVFGRTMNRNLLGTMTDYATMARHVDARRTEPETPEELMRFLARTPILPLNGDRPIDLTLAAFGVTQHPA